MSFIFLKVLELGYNRHKKNKAAKKAQKEAELYYGQPPYPNGQPQPYPMSEYPTGLGPGTDTRFPAPPQPPQSKREKLAYMLISIVRFFQFVLGLTVIGLYGRDVRHDHKYDDTWNSKWVYALIMGCLATLTAMIHLVIPFLMRKSASASARGAGITSKPGLQLPQFVWEFVLCILWLTLFGLFGKMYIGVYPEKKDEKDSKESGLGDSGRIDRMRHAVWIDLINLLLWVSTSSWILLKWLKARRAQAGPVVVDAEKGDENSI